jgi:hypothetical protein
VPKRRAGCQCQKTERIMDAKEHPICFRGYVKKENGGHVAICIDLNIVGQGKTPNEAIHQCVELICEYLSYIKENYPKDFEKFVPRQSPPEFIAEYNTIVSKTINPQGKTVKEFPYNFPIDGKSLTYCYA